MNRSVIGMMFCGALCAVLLDSQHVLAKGRQSETTFTIQTDQDVGCWGDFGRFRSSGAIKDRGPSEQNCGC